ncbi:MAG: hypothetical protein ACM3NQ_21045 [Bacteroidales bacterium]
MLADKGDTAGATALVRQVLAEDPHYAPASALLDRLNKGSLPRVPEASPAEDTTRAGVGADSPVSAPPALPAPPAARVAAAPAARASQTPPPAPPRTAHGSWAQFERRMRVRREATCAAAMRQAMDAGDYATALARARDLAEMDPAWDDVRLLLEHDLGSLPTQEASVPAPSPRRRFPRLVVVALALFVLTAIGGWVVGRFFAPTAPREAIQGVAPVPPPSAAVEVPGLPPIGTAPPTAEPAASLSVGTPSAAAAPAPRSEQPPVRALSEKEKRIAKDGGRGAPAAGDWPDSRVAATGPPTKPPAPPLPQQYMQSPSGGRPAQPPASSSSYPPSTAATAGTSGSNSLASGSSDTASRPPIIAVESGVGALQTLPMVASQPEPAPPSLPSAATRSDSTSATGTTSSSSVAAGNSDERRGVAATLAAYQQGYGARDAAAVQRVWPGVDAQQLRSAFAQLESQRLAFSGCSIDVRGLHASATCSGTATYVPKVGSGEPVKVQRTWQFALQKFGDGWLIDAATAR